MTPGEIIKKIRVQNGLKGYEFAKMIGLKPSGYNMIETGKNNPTFEVLKKIIVVFNVDANIFFETDQIENNNPIDGINTALRVAQYWAAILKSKEDAK